jgi:hypothetical protein
MNQSTRVSLTKISHNAKTGPIPVSTVSEKTCPPSCPFKKNGCYADNGPLAIHWRKVTEGSRGVEWPEFCDQIKSLPRGQLWRHSQSGDLPGAGEHVNSLELAQLVAANKGRKGFTYTHKYNDSNNHSSIKHANDNGFTINLSANSLEHADKLAKLNIGPIVAVVPSDISTKTVFTPEGRKGIVCPATYKENVNCASCGLCQVSKRSVIILFPAHGTSKKKVNQVVSV